MHHGTCATHMLWCMLGSLTRGGGKKAFPCMRNPQFYMSGKRPMYPSLCLSQRWHSTETYSALLTICAGNSPIPGEFPVQRSVTRSFDVFFDLRLNKRLSKQWWGWWFETLSHPLWRHRNGEKFAMLSRHHGAVSISRCRLASIGILMSKMRPSYFQHEIPKPGKDGLYIETGPGHVESKDQSRK